ncbi:MAG: TonB-dependent receptor [Gemmatimonadota bacterium]
MFKRMIRSAALLAVQSAVSAQENPLASADSTLDACITAAAQKDEKSAKAAGDRAFSLYGTAADQPHTAVHGLTGQARVISQCRIPFASFMRQGALVEESIDLVVQALQIDSMSFGARFMLAMNYFSMPAFLGKTEDAVQQFERLIALHGNRKEIDGLATAYLSLGELYERQKKHEQPQTVWQRGSALFPDHAELKTQSQKPKKEEPVNAASSAATVAPTPAPASAPAPASIPQFVLKPIVVEAGSYSVEDPRSATALKRLDVYTAPGGAADMLQVFQMMPGATRATDGSDLYVRGGDPTESPVFLDGARLFHPGTFESLDGSVFGVLDPAVLKNAYFSAGGFSARYGNALSGVLEVETEGRPDVLRWRAGANLATAGGTLYAPLGPKFGAFVSSSATETSAMLRMHGRSEEYGTAPRSAQGIASVVYVPRPGTQLRIVGLSESDQMEIPVDAYGYAGDLRATGATRVAALAGRWLHSGSQGGLRGSASFSERVTGFRFGVLDRDRSDRGVSVKLDGDYAPATRVRLRAGLEAARLEYTEVGMVPSTEDLTPGAPVTRLDEERSTEHAGGYVETELRLTSDIAVIAGARADRLPGESVGSFDPRLAIAFRVGDWTLRAGGGVYHQGRWRVRYRVPDAGLPAGIATRAEHFAVGAQRSNSIRVEAFLKRYSDYVEDGAGPQISSGRYVGVDALLRYTVLDRVTGWVSYSMLDATVELANGERVRAPNDVTHTFTGVARTSLSERWELGTTLRLGTGRPFTPILGGESIEGSRGYRPVYGDITSERLPAYVRVDTRIMRLQPIAGRLIVCYLEALNVLDHHNVLAYTYDRTYQKRGSVASFFSDRTLVFGVEAQF